VSRAATFPIGSIATVMWASSPTTERPPYPTPVTSQTRTTPTRLPTRSRSCSKRVLDCGHFDGRIRRGRPGGFSSRPGRRAVSTRRSVSRAPGPRGRSAPCATLRRSNGDWGNHAIDASETVPMRLETGRAHSGRSRLDAAPTHDLGPAVSVSHVAIASRPPVGRRRGRPAPRTTERPVGSHPVGCPELVRGNADTGRSPGAEHGFRAT
jgi:hypothetical protein